MRKTVFMIAVALIVASPVTGASELNDCARQNPSSVASCKSLANSGNPDGMFGLGMLFLEGIGVQRNFEKSFELMYQAALLGHANAQLQVGQAYVNGQGTSRNFEEGYAWLLVAKENGNEIAQQGIDLLDQKGLIQKSRMNSVTQRANDLYAKTENKKGFQYGSSQNSLPVGSLQEYCDQVMPTVDAIIQLRKYDEPRSAAQQLIIGMTDRRAIRMLEGVIDWVWTSKIHISRMRSDFGSKCLSQSSEVGFIFP